ncbi:PH domain-containing protein [Actinomycetaceae bacterium L2_0104]
MKFSPKLLGKNEHVILHMRTHIKELIPRFVFTVLVIVAAVLAYVYLPLSWRPTSGWVILAVAITLLLIFLVWPWMNWLTSTYTVTNRRLITRTGVFTKTGHDIPLTRISNVSYEHSLLDRMFGCGTLVLQTSASEPLYLHDIPKVEKVHVMLTDLLFHSDLAQQDAYQGDSQGQVPAAPAEPGRPSGGAVPTTPYAQQPSPQPEPRGETPRRVDETSHRPAAQQPRVQHAPESASQSEIYERESYPAGQDDPDFPLSIEDDSPRNEEDRGTERF